jgi:hypothetical protein
VAWCADRYPEVFEVWLRILDQEESAVRSGVLMKRLKAMLGKR